jgi:hypothetical protein
MTLSERCEYLETQLHLLQSAIAPRLLFPIAWKLNRGEASVLASLYTAPDGFRSTRMLQTCSEVFSASTPGVGVVGTRIHQLRAKLKAYGIAIENRFAEGYVLPKASRAIIAQAIIGG